MKNSIFLFFLFLSTIGIASPNESARQYYAGRMYNAFLIQSIGETRMAYRVFKGAYQDAQNAGESPRKLEIMKKQSTSEITLLGWVNSWRDYFAW